MKYIVISLSPHYDKEAIFGYAASLSEQHLDYEMFFSTLATSTHKKSPLCGERLHAWRRHACYLAWGCELQEMHLIPLRLALLHKCVSCILIGMAAAASISLFNTQSSGVAAVN
jgi:hypothetical protein